MNTAARLGFPRLATLLTLPLLLGGCKTQWDRWNDHYLGPDYDPIEYDHGAQAISLMRPGQTRVEEARKQLGPSLKPMEPNDPEAESYMQYEWGPGWKRWDIRFSTQGVLMSCSRWGIGNLGMFLDAAQADEFDRWYVCNLSMNQVPPERAAGFVPGITTQEVVFAAWGPATSVQATETGGFTECWGAHGNNWTLQFDADGVLTTAPQHYVSSH